MRNNADRFGPATGPDAPQDQDPIPTTQQNANISFPMAVEAVDLPSKGLYYQPGHPLHGAAHVEIRHMTAKDEEILSSRSLLQKGIALDKMVQGLFVNKQILLEDLLIGDKNAVILSARIMGYGEEYKPQIICTSCMEKSVYTFNLNSIKQKQADTDVPVSSNGTFSFELPLSKFNVTLRLLKGKDEKELQQLAEKKKKHGLPDSPILDQMKQMVVSVNGNSSREMINKTLEELSPRDAKYIREQYAKVSPNVDFKQKFECPKCGNEEEVMMPFTAEFFWPNK